MTEEWLIVDTEVKEEITLRSSIRRFIDVCQSESGEVDFFADNSSIIATPSKDDSPMQTEDCRYKRQFEVDRRDPSEHQTKALTSSDDDIYPVNDIHCQSHGIIETSDEKKSIKNDEINNTVSGVQKCVDLRFQSPDSSISSYLQKDIAGRYLGKIKEVSFEQSSARPSFKDTKIQRNDIDQMPRLLIFDDDTKDVSSIRPLKVASKPIDLAMLKRKYLGKPILINESPKVHIVKSQGDHPYLQTQADDKRALPFLKKKIKKELSCNSKSSIENSMCTPLMPKYHLSDSHSKNYYQTNTIVKNNRKSSIKDCILERKQSKSVGKSFIFSELSDSVSLSLIHERRNLKKSMKLNRKLQRALSPFELSNAFKGGHSHDDFVNIKHKIREHQRMTAKIRPRVIARPTGKHVLPVEKKTQLLQYKSNLFRDPMLLTKSHKSITDNIHSGMIFHTHGSLRPYAQKDSHDRTVKNQRQMALESIAVKMRSTVG